MRSKIRFAAAHSFLMIYLLQFDEVFAAFRRYDAIYLFSLFDTVFSILLRRFISRSSMTLFSLATPFSPLIILMLHYADATDS
jgi:hypothetical protein